MVGLQKTGPVPLHALPVLPAMFPISSPCTERAPRQSSMTNSIWLMTAAHACQSLLCERTLQCKVDQETSPPVNRFFQRASSESPRPGTRVRWRHERRAALGPAIPWNWPSAGDWPLWMARPKGLAYGIALDASCFEVQFPCRELAKQSAQCNQAGPTPSLKPESTPGTTNGQRSQGEA